VKIPAASAVTITVDANKIRFNAFFIIFNDLLYPPLRDGLSPPQSQDYFSFRRL
jgi:hypothetical protein